jgi:uncharacterized membrane protein
MPVVIEYKERRFGVATPPALDAETTVVEFPGAEEDYIVEGYVDLSQLQYGDAVEVREYIAVDGANYRLFVVLTVYGPVSEPVVRFHAKTLLYNMKYKVTVVQISGTLRSFPYGFIQEVMKVV